MHIVRVSLQEVTVSHCNVLWSDGNTTECVDYKSKMQLHNDFSDLMRTFYAAMNMTYRPNFSPLCLAQWQRPWIKTSTGARARTNHRDRRIYHSRHSHYPSQHLRQLRYVFISHSTEGRFCNLCTVASSVIPQCLHQVSITCVMQLY